MNDEFCEHKDHYRGNSGFVNFLSNFDRFIVFCYIFNMITVPEATKKIIERSRYLSEAMSKDLINLSSLARYIKNEVEEITFKKVSEASILMALKRLSENTKPPTFKNVFTSMPDMIIRSNLFEITLHNSPSLLKIQQELVKACGSNQKYFFTMTKGLLETTIIASADLEDEVFPIVTGEEIVSQFSHLSAITIRLPKDVIDTPGIFYFLIKSLAWDGVNILEIVSTYLEFTLILEEKEVNHAFSILKSIFSNT